MTVAEVTELERIAEMYNADLRREYSYYVNKCPDHGLTPMPFEEFKIKAEAITEAFIEGEKTK